MRKILATGAAAALLLTPAQASAFDYSSYAAEQFRENPRAAMESVLGAVVSWPFMLSAVGSSLGMKALGFPMCSEQQQTFCYSSW